MKLRLLVSPHVKCWIKAKWESFCNDVLFCPSFFFKSQESSYHALVFIFSL